ncbi:hypothetical protein RD792_001187 [Penstemon davidsonii]|uniref:Kinesin motor domain-containing protein n=1 Tax=Penstemon davidsonii TaxID=160366 RepID=A0ABR0DMZ5_9LAMI|nr:hypothetical protein RD792_001187 [Penstemon davidsonii]
MESGEERIYVSVRLRPLNSNEIYRNDVSDWECINDKTIVYKNVSLSASDRSMYPTAYTFDRVFRSDSTTREVYEQGAKDVAISVVSGMNSSVFAYGQTSSGKTFTMTGVTEYAIADIYDYILKHQEREFVMKFSAMEIYNESVRDLLGVDSSPLRLLDDPERGTIVEKLTEEVLRDWNHVIQLLSVCEAQRQIGETSLNEMSSRSHQIIRLTIESTSRELLGRDNANTLTAAVNFVDLAGSERASQSLSAGTRLKEGCHINRSLLTLGTVIRKLSKGRNGHIPYRDSKLTRILQTSLGGNAKTAVICTMSPARSHVEQSRNTLLFASCAKEVTTNAQVNVVVSDKALVKHLQRELARLESELRSPLSTLSQPNYSAILREKDTQIEKLEKEIKDLILQRDIAQSQVRNMFQMLGDDASSVTPVDSGHYPHLQESPDTQIREHQISILADPPHSSEHSRTSSEDHFAEIPYFDDNFVQSDPSPRILISSSNYSESDSYSGNWEEIEKQSNGTPDELCREVRCIETENTVNENVLAVELTLCPLKTDNEMKEDIGWSGGVPMEDREPISEDDKELALPRPCNNEKAINSIHFLEKLDEDSSGSRSLKLARSRSCKSSIFADSASLWSKMMDYSQSTSSFVSERESVACFKRRISPIIFGSNEQSSSRKEFSYSPEIALDIEIDTPNIKFSSDDQEVISSIDCDKKKTELPTEEQVIKNSVEEIEPKGNESLKKHVKDIGLDPIEDENRGDPSDAIYVEVEMRRMKFLKDKFSKGEKTIVNGQHLTLASSEKALRKERRMLSKQMGKKLSEQERESLFLKWDIGLNTKYRRLQLAHLVWTKTEDITHISDSANLVAKLVGLIEPGQAPNKEMFGLDFTPRCSTRTYSFRRSLISFL